MLFDVQNRTDQQQLLLLDTGQELRPAASDEFDAWINTGNGRAVWHWFVFFARQARDAGFKRFSARAIAERIRWQVEIETPLAGRFKLNDHHLPRLARKLMAEMPEQFGDFFEIRELRK